MLQSRCGCISIAPGHEGALLWQTSWQPPLGDLTISYGTGSSEEGVFTLRGKETRQVWGFSTETGAELWGPTDSLNYLGIFGIGSSIAYGKLFVNAKMAGVVTLTMLKQVTWSGLMNPAIHITKFYGVISGQFNQCSLLTEKSILVTVNTRQLILNHEVHLSYALTQLLVMKSGE